MISTDANARCQLSFVIIYSFRYFKHHPSHVVTLSQLTFQCFIRINSFNFIIRHSNVFNHIQSMAVFAKWNSFVSKVGVRKVREFIESKRIRKSRTKRTCIVGQNLSILMFLDLLKFFEEKFETISYLCRWSRVSMSWCMDCKCWRIRKRIFTRLASSTNGSTHS